MSEWIERPLGAFARIRRGASPRPIDAPRWFAEEGPGWVRISDVTRADGMLRETEQCLSPDGVARSIRVGRGDVLMSICATIGEPIIVDMDACIHDGFVVFDQFDGKLDLRFLLHLLRRIAPRLRAQGQTGTQANINTGIVNSFRVRIPEDTTEQSHIAVILDLADEAIARTEAVIAKLKQVRAGLLHDLLTYGIDENGEVQDPIRHPERFQDSPLGQVRKSWLVAPLSQFLQSAEYGISTSLSSDGMVPVLRMNNLANGEAVLDDLKFTTREVPQNLLLRNGDVLFNRTNSYEHVGRTGIWRGQLSTATFASYLVRLNAAPGRLSSEFLNLLLNMPESQQRMRQFATPSVQQVNINPTSLQKMLVAVPKQLPEQDRIVESVHTSARSLAAQDEELRKLTAIKLGLTSDLLSGHVRVPESLSIVGAQT